MGKNNRPHRISWCDVLAKLRRQNEQREMENMARDDAMQREYIRGRTEQLTDVHTAMRTFFQWLPK